MAYNVVPFISRPNRRQTGDADGSAVVLPFGTGRAVYTVREVADLLSLSLGGTYTLVRSGQIPALKLGGRWVIPKKRFHAWLDSCTDNGDVKGCG